MQRVKHIRCNILQKGIVFREHLNNPKQANICFDKAGNVDSDQKDIKTLAKYFKEQSSINLSKSEFSDAGVDILSDYLKHNSKITSVDLSDNSITNVGAIKIIMMLKDNKTINDIQLSGNDINDNILQEIQEILDDRKNDHSLSPDRSSQLFFSRNSQNTYRSYTDSVENRSEKRTGMEGR